MAEEQDAVQVETLPWQCVAGEMELRLGLCIELSGTLCDRIAPVLAPTAAGYEAQESERRPCSPVVEATWEWADAIEQICELICDEEENPLQGMKLNLECSNIKTKKGGDFTKHFWNPIEEEE